MSPKQRKRGPWKPPGKFARTVGKVLPKDSGLYKRALRSYESRRKRAIERRKSR